MRVGGLIVAASLVLGACGDAAAAPTTYRPVETEPMVIVTFPRASRTPFVVPTIAVADSVVLAGSTFDPPQLLVPRGTTVTWTSRDPIAHTVTSGVPGFPDGAWDAQLGGDRKSVG